MPARLFCSRIAATDAKKTRPSFTLNKCGIDNVESEDSLSLFTQMSTEEKSDVKILLHSCCAPCSGAMIEELQEQQVDVTVFFYNPNIQPRKDQTLNPNRNLYL